MRSKGSDRRIALAVGFALASAGMAVGQPIVEDRIANFRDMGSAFKNVGDELKSGRPNAARIRQGAKVIRDYSTHVGAWFPANSRPASASSQGFIERLRAWLMPGDDVGSVKSHAKAEIWTRPAEFRRAVTNFQVASQRLYDASAGGDVAAIGARHRALGATCQQCHDRFREKMK